MWVEADERELRAIVGAVEAVGAPDLCFPLSGESGGLMDVSVQGEEGLALLDEPFDGHAADVDVEGCVVNCFSVECGAVEYGVVGR